MPREMNVSPRDAKLVTSILDTQADRVAYYGRQLSMNFDVPALSIIDRACDEFGITRKQWDALQHVRIQRAE